MRILDKISADVGGYVVIAKKLGLTPQAVYFWAKIDKVPAKWIQQLSKMTNGRITKEQIRPDLYAD